MKKLFTFFFGYLAGLIRFLGFHGSLSFTVARYESLKKCSFFFLRKITFKHYFIFFISWGKAWVILLF